MGSSPWSVRGEQALRERERAWSVGGRDLCRGEAGVEKPFRILLGQWFQTER